VVAARLRKLAADDCLVRAAHSGGRRADYRLTPKGRELFPVALMMLRWQHRWPSGKRGYVVNLTHHSCGKASEPVPSCAQCHAEVDPREVAWREGPGLAQVAALYERRRSPSTALDGKRDKVALADTVIRIFGDRWATLVVRALFTGIHRFDEIRRDTLMATNILAGRIDMLIRQGVIKAVPYSDHPDRHEYRLTAKGRDIYPILLALLQWGDAWYADERGPWRSGPGHGRDLQRLW
jgi:DNA-binding HxlR family transcriptional regulator